MTVLKRSLLHSTVVKVFVNIFMKNFMKIFVSLLNRGPGSELVLYLYKFNIYTLLALFASDDNHGNETAMSRLSVISGNIS